MRFSYCLIALIGLTISGCGGDGRPNLVKVESTVTLDGEPLDGVMLSFAPADGNEIKRGSKGLSTAGGKFTVGTYANDDGIPVGKYKVTASKQELVGELPENYNPEDPGANTRPVKYKLIVPEKYNDAEQSGLTVEITSKGMTPDTISLTSDGKGPQTTTVGGRPANEP